MDKIFTSGLYISASLELGCWPFCHWF